MARVSKKVSEKLEAAAEEVLQKINPDTIEEQVENTGKPKRHRRTKAEMQAAREAATNVSETNVTEENNEVETKAESVFTSTEDFHIIATVDWDKDEDDDTVLPSTVQIPDSILVGDYDSETVSNYITESVGYCHKGFKLEWPAHHESQEQFCQWELEKAHLKGLKEPDFDFRDFYCKGDTIFFVRYYPNLNTKDLFQLTVRTVYPRALTGVTSTQYCQYISINERDNVFKNRSEAQDFYNNIELKPVNKMNDDEDMFKKKKRRKKVDYDSDAEEYDDEEEVENIEENVE